MNCRHCESAVTIPFLDLGAAPPSNSYLTQADLSAPEKHFPLRVLVCTECWLVQTEDFAAHDELFTSEYAYFSSTSSSWLDHARRYVADMIARFDLKPEALVVEVASNDGYLLQYVRAAGIGSLGIEPTASTAQAARDKGIAVEQAFFGRDLARRLVSEGRSADLTAANNVLAHVPDINDFVEGFAMLLKPDGVATFEFPHLLQLVEHGQFDTVYHEHFSYLSLLAVDRIMSANGLSVFDVEELPTHGGSLRVFAQRVDGVRDTGPAVEAMLERERTAGMSGEAYYAGFQDRADRIKDEFVRFLIDTKAGGKTVAAYGAAAKGNTLMNYAGIRPDLLPWVVDRAEAKCGKFMPGSRVPIVHEEAIKKQRPDFIVILPWNLRSEVMEQLGYIREWGGQFVTAVPRLTIQ